MTANLVRHLFGSRSADQRADAIDDRCCGEKPGLEGFHGCLLGKESDDSQRRGSIAKDDAGRSKVLFGESEPALGRSRRRWRPSQLSGSMSPRSSVGCGPWLCVRWVCPTESVHLCRACNPSRCLPDVAHPGASGAASGCGSASETVRVGLHRSRMASPSAGRQLPGPSACAPPNRRSEMACYRAR